MQRLQISDDDREQIIEVVRNAPGQLSDAFHLLRLPRPFIGGASFRQVAGNLGKSQEFALRRFDRVDNDTRPKRGAILADAPAFRLVFAGRCRDRQCLCGHPLGPFIFSIKPRKVMADDLLARIALDPFRACVPVHHMTLRIQHVDRVIGNALDQQPEAAFGILEFRLAGGELEGALFGPLFERLVDALKLLLRLAARFDFLLIGL